MTSVIPTSKALYTARIDIGSAPRAYSDRFNLPGCDLCIDPDAYNRDQYGRMADPFTLKRDQQSCNNIDSIYNVQNFLIRENNLERPFLNPPLVGRYQPYDTMGVGRNFQGPRAGCGADGAWWQINMPKNPAGCNDRPAPMDYYTSGQCNTALGSLYRLQYNG